MSHEKSAKEKIAKKMPLKTLKEKRAAKAAKRDEQGLAGRHFVLNPTSKMETH